MATTQHFWCLSTKNNMGIKINLTIILPRGNCQKSHKSVFQDLIETEKTKTTAPKCCLQKIYWFLMMKSKLGHRLSLKHKFIWSQIIQWNIWTWVWKSWNIFVRAWTSCLNQLKTILNSKTTNPEINIRVLYTKIILGISYNNRWAKVIREYRISKIVFWKTNYISVLRINQYV